MGTYIVYVRIYAKCCTAEDVTKYVSLNNSHMFEYVI